MLTRFRLGRPTAAIADRSGVAALEFALIAPLMILLYFGLAELSSAIIAARHTNQASASVGDLVAQCSNLNDPDTANIFGAASDILAPLPVTTLQLRVSSFVQTANNSPNTTVQWSLVPNGQSGLAAYTQGSSPFNLPAGLTNSAGDTVIVSEAVYQFNFPVDLFNGLIHFDDVAYYKPRKSVQVAYTGSGPGGNATNTSCSGS